MRRIAASTLHALTPTGQPAGVAKVFNHATKLMQLCDYPVGVASWGSGTVKERSISSLVQEYANQRPKFGELSDPPSVEHEAQGLMRLLFDFYQGAYPNWQSQAPDQRPGFGVFVGGYSGNEFFPKEFVFNIPDRQFLEKRIPLQDGSQDFGADWFGATDALVRFHHGRDDRLTEILTRHGIAQPTVEAVMRTLQEELQYPVPFGGMPLQDAIEYAIFMVGIEVARYRFALGAELCGGPVDVAAITPENGFIWIQKKTVTKLDLGRPFQGDKR